MEARYSLVNNQALVYNTPMLQLKTLTLKSRVIQSPMAGCTDLAYRLIAREYGMEFSFLEMTAAEALIRKNEATFELMKTAPEDKPLGAQLVGCRPEAMGEAAKMVEDMGFDLLDINLGCPAPKIAGHGAGSALLSKPEEARRIFAAVVKNVKKIPVTVKMRLGVENPSGDEAVAIAKAAEASGITAVTVHGRTRAQGYSGAADYQAIAKVKQAVKIPVIGNGDVLTAADAKRMLETAACDGIMIGRGGLGNPWIFKSLERALSGGEPAPPPALEEKKKAALRHLELELAHRGEKTAVLHMRRIACWYFKNEPGVTEFRSTVNACQSAPELRRLIEDF
ncbi:MAG: tRNA dihydrouridine synthase DusB [Candidatus Omnitrophica bacterium]|nr:tRNA dihydrouridine synthase DusB [Candidatus Omnitrophota bacterium]